MNAIIRKIALSVVAIAAVSLGACTQHTGTNTVGASALTPPPAAAEAPAPAAMPTIPYGQQATIACGTSAEFEGMEIDYVKPRNGRNCPIKFSATSMAMEAKASEAKVGWKGFVVAEKHGKCVKVPVAVEKRTFAGTVFATYPWYKGGRPCTEFDKALLAGHLKD